MATSKFGFNAPPAPRCDAPNDNVHFSKEEVARIETCSLPRNYDRPSWQGSYGSQAVPLPHPFYRTSSMEHGWYPPNVHTAPSSFHPSQQRFTSHLGKCGMYRNSSLNTVMDPTPLGQ